MTSAHPLLTQLVPAGEAESVACLIVEPGLFVSFATPAAERMLGVARGSLTGITVEQLLPLERRGELKNFEDVLSGGGGRRLRSALRLSDGRRIDVSLALTPLLNGSGRVIAVGARYEAARSSAEWVKASLGSQRPSLAPPLSSVPSPALDASPSHQQPASLQPAPSVVGLLHQVDLHLRWLEERVGRTLLAGQPPEELSEQERALHVLRKARKLVRQSAEALGCDPAAAPIPAPPKLPEL